MLKLHDRTIGRWLVMLVLGAVLVGLVSACGGGSSSTSATSETSEATSGQEEGTAGESSTISVSQLLEETTEEQPPSTSPPPAKGKSVWFVSCGQAVKACAIDAEAAEEAAKAIGFDFHLADAKLNAGGGDAAAVREAIAAKADGIITDSLACQYITQALVEAKEANIPVLNFTGIPNCPSGNPGFAAEFQFTKSAPTTEKFLSQWGEFSAKYLISKTEGDAKVLVNGGTQPPAAQLQEGFEAGLAECSTCEVVKNVEFSNPDLTPNGPWITSFRSAVVSTPNANSTFIPLEPMMRELGGMVALKEAGHSDWPVVGGNGGEAAMEYVKDGTLAACTGCHDSVWAGWGTIDSMNRILNGQPVVPAGAGFHIVDQSNYDEFVAPNGYFQSPIGYKAAYEKAWSEGAG